MAARLPTVYDFSSLRLHPDGSRVQQSTSKNQKLRYAAGVVQDSRGNWYARDAAGSGTVGRYRKVREEKEQNQEKEEEWNDVKEGEDSSVESSSRKDKGKGKETTGRRHNPRPAKRQKFMQDLDFLTPTASNEPSSTDSLPSSDLLKSIHYFASSYYDARGQLFNATKEYRQMRKQNKLRRLEQQRKVAAAGDDSENLDEDSGQDEINRLSRGGRKKGVIGKTVHRKDMYKMLDGSALMAIGMLIQEYVSRTLEVRIPDGWEDMMQDADIDQEASSDSQEDEGLGADVTDVKSTENAGKHRESEGDESGEEDDDNESVENKDNQVYEEEEEEEVGD